ncbi:MAG: hypothetical protein HYV60_21790 [Planctomycetia bacterium]|nr:hypothetical protein [Planctomycetia bacterium]
MSPDIGLLRGTPGLLRVQLQRESDIVIGEQYMIGGHRFPFSGSVPRILAILGGS